MHACMYSMAFEMKENMSCLTTWMDLGDIMLTGGHYVK